MKSTNIRLLLVFCIAILMVGNLAAKDKPSFDIDWYGYFKLDGAYDQNLTSNGNFVMWINQRTNDADDEQFNMTHRQSRFGFKAVGNGYHDVSVFGKLEFDLYGSGGTENKTLFLLRHAFFSIKKQGFELMAGQTWDLISPLNPSTLNYSVLWNCGNLGYRRPQVRFGYSSNPENNTVVSFAAGAFRTIGDDLISLSLSLDGENADSQDDGTDAGIPSVQGYLDVNHSWTEGGSVRLGASGLYGQLKAETDQGNSETYKSWAASGHLMLSIPGDHGISGEVFSGTNLGNYNGGIGLSSQIDGLDAIGGWVSAWAQVTPTVKFSIGGGMDDPDEASISSGRVKNTCFYGNIVFTIIPAAQIGLEVAQWQTDYKDADSAKNLRAQTSFILNF